MQNAEPSSQATARRPPLTAPRLARLGCLPQAPLREWLPAVGRRLWPTATTLTGRCLLAGCSTSLQGPTRGGRAGLDVEHRGRPQRGAQLTAWTARRTGRGDDAGRPRALRPVARRCGCGIAGAEGSTWPFALRLSCRRRRCAAAVARNAHPACLQAPGVCGPRQPRELRPHQPQHRLPGRHGRGRHAGEPVGAGQATCPGGAHTPLCRCFGWRHAFPAGLPRCPHTPVCASLVSRLARGARTRNATEPWGAHVGGDLRRSGRRRGRPRRRLRGRHPEAVGRHSQQRCVTQTCLRWSAGRHLLSCISVA